MNESSIRDESDTRALAHALAQASVLGHPATDTRLVETHISVVVLAGEHAYKLRKPVLLPFLDFRTLDARREDCERELALNRRWAPEIYQRVVAIHGSLSAPELEGAGPVLDYAVQMRRFPDAARLDRAIASQGLDDALTTRLANSVARMHIAAPVAATASGWGRAELVAGQVTGNLDDLAEAPLQAPERARLERLSAFSLQELERHHDTFRLRLEAGRVRECHGDLHLANLVLLDGEVVPFDGVEFREDFRWVDIISDLAFLLMDLHRVGHADRAWRLLDIWLEQTGDYAGLALLRHYLVYRAMVRAKVEAIRYRQQPGAHDTDAATRGQQYRSVAGYLALADRLSRPSRARGLIITHGVSGSGKTFIARQLLPGLGAILVRSDVERRRLYPLREGRYAPSATRRVYEHLLQRARQILDADYPVMLDATFLEPRWRDAAAHLAAECGVAFRILAVSAPRPVLESRIVARNAAGDDASEADLSILDRQLDSGHALDAADEERVTHVDSSRPVDPASIIARLDLPEAHNGPG